MAERPAIPHKEPLLELWAVVCDGRVMAGTATTDADACTRDAKSIATHRPGLTCRAVRFSSPVMYDVSPEDAGAFLGGLIRGAIVSHFDRRSDRAPKKGPVGS